MLAYTFFETDGRVIRYCNALVMRGDQVDVIALRKKGQPPFEIINGVNLYRIQERKLDERDRLSYLTRIMKFFIKSALLLMIKHLQNNYDIIHVHSVPDLEVFAALLPKFAGAKIILDIHDIVPEFYASKFDTKRNSTLYKLLILAEKVSIAFSNHVIISNHIWKKTLTSRSVSDEKCSVILNYPDNSIFFPRNRTEKDDKFTVLYPGTLAWHQGLDIAIKAFAMIKYKVPKAEFYIYGDGPKKNDLTKLIKDLGLEKRVFLERGVPIEKIANLMANADLGVVPKRNGLFGGEAFSTKILEFMRMGIPVIVSETKIDRYYFDDSIVKFFEPENELKLAEAMLSLITNSEHRKNLVKKALKYVEKNNWEVRKHIYLDLVDSLVART